MAKIEKTGEGGAFATKGKEPLQKEEKIAIKCIIPPEGTEKVGHYCFNILARVLEDKDKKKLPHKWFRNYELFRARHWRSKGNTRLSTVNMIWTYVTRTCNLLTDQNPTFDIQAEADEPARLINKASTYWWNETEQQDVYADSVLTAEVCGAVIEKVIFNPTLNNGLGEVETISIDPHFFGFWPLNEKRPHKWEAALYYYTIPVNQARRRWPDMADRIQADKTWRKQLGEGRHEVYGGTTTAVPGETGDYGVDHASFSGNVDAVAKMMGKEDEVLILEFWVKDYSQEKVLITPESISIQGETGVVTRQEAVFENRNKYPGNVRCITTCNMGDVVLSDRKNPSINPLLAPELASRTYLWDKFPFTLTASNKDVVSPWGFSSIEQLEMLNFEIDKCLSQLNIMKDKAVRSPVINPKDSGIPNSHFTNQVAQVVRPKNHVVAGAIGFMKPPPPQRDIELVLNIYREMFDKISGVFDMTDPSIAKGRMAYKTVATIIESMHTMLRGKIRGYGRMLRDRGRMWLSHAQNWYTEDRIMFSKTEAGVTEVENVTSSQMLIPIHFTVVSGSTMPTSRMQQREEAKELHAQGAIDIRELLIRLDWPDRLEVIKRMEMGVIGATLERMEALGVSPEVMQMVQQIANMDESEYNAAVNQMKKAQADAAKAGGTNAAV